MVSSVKDPRPVNSSLHKKFIDFFCKFLSSAFIHRRNHIVFGSLTVLLGILAFFFLVDRPTSKLLRLTEEEKRLVEERTQDNAVVRTTVIKKYQIKEAILEPRLWLISLAVLGIQFQNGGLLVFSAQFIKGLGSFSVSTLCIYRLGKKSCNLNTISNNIWDFCVVW